MKNQPAFPTTQYANGISPSGFDSGMTLRDYFAAKAMQGLIINLDLRPNTHNVGIVGTNVGMNIGAFSYWMADVMMKARDNRE